MHLTQNACNEYLSTLFETFARKGEENDYIEKLLLGMKLFSPLCNQFKPSKFITCCIKV